MEPNNELNKSSRTFEEWKQALRKLIDKTDPTSRIKLEDERIKPYYDQALMPDVCFKELFNR